MTPTVYVAVVQPLLRSAIIRTPITGCGPRSKCGAASLDTGDSRHAVLGPGTRVQIVDRYTCADSRQIHVSTSSTTISPRDAPRVPPPPVPGHGRPGGAARVRHGRGKLCRRAFQVRNTDISGLVGAVHNLRDRILFLFL